MNVISIMAHQDDEMFCLGKMLRCQARGDRLGFITLTDGSKGFVQKPDIAPSDAARIRHEEMSALAHTLDAEYINLAEPDEFLLDTPAVRLKLIEAIRAVGADPSFTHFSEDYNLDHIATNLLIRQCAMQSCLPVLPTRSHPLQNHPAVFLVEPHGPISFTPSYYVDISGVQTKKAELVGHHHSQEEAMQQIMGPGLADYITKVSVFRGFQSGCAHAEGFVPMPARGALKPYPVLP